MKKMIGYGKQSIDRRDISHVVKVLESDWLTQGPELIKFEQKLAEYVGAKYSVAVSNGTAALHLALLAAGVGKGDEVVTSTMTFVASANAAGFCGAEVKLADIGPKTGLIDINDMQKKINNRTKVIVPVDYAGQACDYNQVVRVAKKHGLIVIEDAAHAIGSKYRGKKIGSGSWADMTTFSFHPVKTMTTGEGGAVVTNSKDLYEKLLMLRTHGIVYDQDKFVTQDKELIGPWWYEMQSLGFNYRMTEMQAALGLSQMTKLERFIVKRRRLFEYYREALAGDERFELIEELPYSQAAFHLCPLLLNLSILKQSKQEIFAKLVENGLRLQVHYIPVHLQPYYQAVGYRLGDFPKAELFFRREISLPLFPSLNMAEVKRVVKILKEVVR